MVYHKGVYFGVRDEDHLTLAHAQHQRRARLQPTRTEKR